MQEVSGFKVLYFSKKSSTWKYQPKNLSNETFGQKISKMKISAKKSPKWKYQPKNLSNLNWLFRFRTWETTRCRCEWEFTLVTNRIFKKLRQGFLKWLSHGTGPQQRKFVRLLAFMLTDIVIDWCWLILLMLNDTLWFWLMPIDADDAASSYTKVLQSLERTIVLWTIIFPLIHYWT